jgi:hypothetical protein
MHRDFHHTPSVLAKRPVSTLTADGSSDNTSPAHTDLLEVF